MLSQAAVAATSPRRETADPAPNFNMSYLGLVAFGPILVMDSHGSASRKNGTRRKWSQGVTLEQVKGKRE